MQTITSGPLQPNPNWTVLNVSPFQYLIDASSGAAQIQLPPIDEIPSGVRLQFGLTPDSIYGAVLASNDSEEYFSNGTTDTTQALIKGFSGSVILTVQEGKWNVQPVYNGLPGSVRISGTISQSSTNAPTLSIGTFSGNKELITITPGYSGVGEYTLTFPTNFFQNAVVTPLFQPNAAYYLAVQRSSDNVIKITTTSFADKLSDNLLSSAGFSIEISPQTTL